MSEGSSFGRLVLIGTGLIGGSLALALRVAGCVDCVVGVGRNRRTLEEARALGIVDEIETDPARAVANADVVFVAVPVGAMAGVFAAIAPSLPAQALVTDGGSVKGEVVEAARRTLGARLEQFVPGHPIAGTEKSGPSAAFAGLYRNRRVILTPLPENHAAQVARARDLWTAAGARVEQMDPARHDYLLAANSHLPHVIAYALVNALGGLDERREVFRYAAGGFRDISRIASSDPRMWRDICLANREQLLSMIGRFHAGLEEIESALRAHDGEALEELFGQAKTIRDGLYREDEGGN
ncbi:MAG: prephenate dehydrogenase [Halothiobacillaceae bacterium]